jgi:hypothetical protein
MQIPDVVSEDKSCIYVIKFERSGESSDLVVRHYPEDDMLKTQQLPGE